VVGKDASRYGVIGVTFAILSWLIVLGMGLVFLVAANAEVGGADSLSKSPQAGGR
jgi:membrane protein